MADSNTEADDWFFFAKIFRLERAKKIGHFSMLIASESLRLCHEFHLVGNCTHPGAFDFQDFSTFAPTKVSIKFSLRSLRGKFGTLNVGSRLLLFDARFANASVIFTAAKEPFTDGGEYSFAGLWLLKQPRVYSDEFET